VATFIKIGKDNPFLFDHTKDSGLSKTRRGSPMPGLSPTMVYAPAS
jgi:hypothetical protein